MNNPTSLADLDVAPVYVNNYLWAVMQKIDPSLTAKYNGVVPFFPLGETAGGNAAWDDKATVVYDRLFTFKKSPFYPIKTEEVHYAVKGTEEEVLLWGSAIQLVLDRMDDAAQDLNDYVRRNYPNACIKFNHLKVFMPSSAVSTAGAQRDFSSRQFYVSKFFVSMEYSACLPDKELFRV